MIITVDFETEAINGDPIVYPPKPVGVSIKMGDKPSEYYTGLDMAEMVHRVWDSSHELLFHNAAFDMRVAEDWLDVEMPEWGRVHDTKFLLYLENPHAQSLSLKPSGVRLLGRNPDEQDELASWILANVQGATKKNWGAFICKGPLDLVSKYAKQDTDLTYEIYQLLKDKVPKEAYDLERELHPHLIRATQKGIRVDTERLGAELELAEESYFKCAEAIYKKIGPVDLGKGAALADALDRAGVISEWKLTPTGKRSTARENLVSAVGDPELLALLSYHGALKTCLQTFMRPWSQLAAGTGRLHPSWNQIRDDDYGTRTGRLSCSGPNLQNVPNPFELALPQGLMPIPDLRDYLLPESGQAWASRDYDGQEMRILAHYESGDLQKAYQDDPRLDPHSMVQELILHRLGIEYSRKQVKGVGFGIIYGMGANGLSKQLGIEYEEAAQLIQAYHSVLPGVGVVQDLTKKRGRNGIPIKTLGGRVYYAEEPRIIKGERRSYEYKLLNYLIQGGAADQTKRAMLDYFKHRPHDETFLCTVHDEINVSVPLGNCASTLRESMEERGLVGLDMTVPMQTSLSVGPTWGQLREVG